MAKARTDDRVRALTIHDGASATLVIKVLESLVETVEGELLHEERLATGEERQPLSEYQLARRRETRHSRAPIIETRSDGLAVFLHRHTARL